ncbi:MAG: FAD-binding domain-containing protein [Rubripirellula sp.]|nr:FAD-binding domain-containing protein [Rubripirellula sp.]
MQVVWFKRDLRVDDHWPLALACDQGPTLCLYVYEPEIIGSEEFDSSHLQFINQSLHELDNRLKSLNGRLTYRVGSMPDVLAALHATDPIAALWSHEESGNRITYDRDKRVAKWLRDHQVEWREIPQNGVIRRLKSRDGWSKQRAAFLKKPLAVTPSEITHPRGISAGEIQPPEALGLTATNKTKLQTGGETPANETLNSFLTDRGQDYSSEMSSPVTAPDSCSRLSTYLAWGCLSMRRVVHELHDRQGYLRELRDAGEPVGGWLKSLRAFESRLSWHCHFMQKLEDEPEIEFNNMSPAYDGLRENEFDQSHFDAWCNAQTGYPMVDACMRALHQHSWINFRMRAMLVSFASYHLWLHWRPTAVYLSRHFLDFEPGIHYSQFQMQSGTTGINAIRIYSPIKQVKDQDPTGKFIRHFVPELATVPDRNLAEPHKMSLAEQSKSGCQIGKHYPPPIVEHVVAYRAAKARMFAVRKQTAARADAERVVRKHGSRKRSNSTRNNQVTKTK